jgi:putative phosphoribosyl transferase
VLAAPVGPPEVIASLRREADQVVCLHTPEMFAAISQWYAQFPQTSDEEVAALLKRATTRAAGSDAPIGAAADASVSAVPDPPGFERDITVGNGDVQLAGHLTIPDRAAGMIIFAHGSGSSRRSPRNRFVAAALNQAGLGTLLADLLTSEEELSRANVFDVRLLAARLTGLTGWLGRHPAARGLPVGYFGASTGAAAALWAAASPRLPIAAIVSRGGRPDLAGPQLGAVRAPTLLIVGGSDEAVLRLNRQAQHQLTCANELTVIPGATHLFEEPGALEQVAQLAAGWFTTHLAAHTPRSLTGNSGAGGEVARRRAASVP